MDSLRSCYRTTMRFPIVGELEIVWYWTDKPPLPYDTIYNSHNHSREEGWEDADTGQLGEVWGAARPYYDGSPLIDSCCSGPEGGADAWIGITDSRSPLYLVPSCEAISRSVKWKRRQKWTATIIPGPTVDALAEHSRSFSASHSGSLLFSITFSNEREVQVTLRTSGDYETDFRSERSMVADYSGGMYYSPSWRQERACSAAIAATGLYATTAAREQGFAVVVSAAFVGSAAWRIQRLLSASPATGFSLSAALKRESLLTVTESCSGSYGVEWNNLRDFSVIVDRYENVQAFNCASLVATGTNQATAALIASDTVLATSTGAGQGIILPAGCYRVLVKNNNAGGGNAIAVYPPTGANIALAAVNAPANLAAQASMYVLEESATHWASVAVTG